MFDQVPDEVGTFIDGSPWVVLPDNTKLISTSPLPTSDTNVSPPLFTNGVGVNPSPGREFEITVDGTLALVSSTNQWNTFDSRTSSDDFNNDIFIANRDALSPDGDGILVAPQDVIVLTDSFEVFDGVGRKTPIRHQAVLSVISSSDKPESESFRPPINWASSTSVSRPLYDASIELSSISAINNHLNPANFDPGVELDDILVGPIIQYSDPINYSAAIAQFNVGLGKDGSPITEADTFVPLLNYLLNQITMDSNQSNISEVDRLRHLKRLVQYGIDCYGAITTLGDLGSLDASKAGMLKQWALFALFVMGDTNNSSVDDMLGNVLTGYSTLDVSNKNTIKSRLFNEDRVLQQLTSTSDGRESDTVAYSVISNQLTTSPSFLLRDRSTKTPYIYGQDSTTNYNHILIDSGLQTPVDHYSDLIGTKLQLNQSGGSSSTHNILMVTDQFEVSDYNTTTFEHDLGFIGPIPGLGYFCSEVTSTFLDDWGIINITIDPSSLDTNINFGLNGEAAANYVLEQKPRIEFNGVPIQYNGDQSDPIASRPARVVNNGGWILELPAAFTTESVDNIISSNVTTVSFARPFKIWFDLGFNNADQFGSVTLDSFSVTDVGGAFFFNNDSSNATASAFNSNIAQKCGRAWLPTYVALRKMYGENSTDIGIVNDWLNAYIFGIDNISRDYWVLENNAATTFGKLETPAAFDDTNTNGWLTE